MHIGKLNIVALLAALGLFFVPWLEVQCQGNSFIQQSGFQAATGKFTMKLPAGMPGGNEMVPKENEKGPKIAVLAAASVGVAALAFLLSLTGAADPGGSKPASLLAIVALGLAIGQMVMGFPAATDIKDEMAKKQPSGKPAGGDPMEAMFAGMGENIVKVQYLPGMWGYLAALGVAGLFGLLATPSRRENNAFAPPPQ